jgi:transcriptional regulator with PAS, ATPase and Fis domain
MKLAEIEQQAIDRALERNDMNRTRAASSLGISLRTLQRKLKSRQH